MTYQAKHITLNEIRVNFCLSFYIILSLNPNKRHLLWLRPQSLMQKGENKGIIL